MIICEDESLLNTTKINIHFFFIFFFLIAIITSYNYFCIKILYYDGINISECFSRNRF